MGRQPESLETTNTQLEMPEATLKASDIDDFIKHAQEKIEAVFENDSIECKKALEVLLRKIQGIRLRFETLSEEHAVALEELEENVQTLISKKPPFKMLTIEGGGFKLISPDNFITYRGGICTERVARGPKGELVEKRRLMPDGSVEGEKYFVSSEDNTRSGAKVIMERFISDFNGAMSVLWDYAGEGRSKRAAEFTPETWQPPDRRTRPKSPQFILVAPDGREFFDYPSERKKNPKLTPNGYLRKLAGTFKSPDDWNFFARHYMKYAYDSPSNKGEYWQTAEETISRVNESGQALGDCDDFAFLAQGILARQGIKAHVVHIEGKKVAHALTAWIRKRPDGKYDAYSICTFGYDKKAGYKTPEAAMNAIYRKYRKTGLGVDASINARVEDGEVRICKIPEKGERDYDDIDVEDLII